MKNERRIKVDFPNTDISTAEIPEDYIVAGESIVDSGEVPSVDVFVKNLAEYNRLQYRLLEKIQSLCNSMEQMVDNEFVIVNSLSPVFEEVDDITEKMDQMLYFTPADEVLDQLERYLDLHQKLFDKPIIFIETGTDLIQKYDL